MESASPLRQSIQAAAVEPEQLSASCGVGADALTHLIQQTPRLQWRAPDRRAEFGACVNTVHNTSINAKPNKIKPS
ncbi:MAG: hypothetical protein ACK5N7_14165, partial [Curvibacter sp.]